MAGPCPCVISWPVPESSTTPTGFYADPNSPETAPFKDKETGSRWTLAGRAVDEHDLKFPGHGHPVHITVQQLQFFKAKREHHRLAFATRTASAKPLVFIGSDWKAKLSPVLYLLGMILTLVSPWLARVPYPTLADRALARQSALCHLLSSE